MKIYSLLLIISSFFISGCFTVPGKDRIVTTQFILIGDPNHVQPLRPLKHPIDRVEYILADQSFRSKLNYINQCMINYSWGRGWTDRQYFQN